MEGTTDQGKARTMTTDQQMQDVLTTALEGGYAEEFTVTELARAEDLTVTEAWLELTEGFEFDEHHPAAEYHLTAAEVRKGWNLLVKEYGKTNTYLGEQVREGLEEGPEYLDAIGADAVLQMACFGEIVFG